MTGRLTVRRLVYKSWLAKNFVNRGTKKTQAPPSLVIEK
jgi:hypothetical protein